MKNFIILLLLLMTNMIGKAQIEVARIPIETNSTGIYEKTNENGMHCFYIDLNQDYLLVVTDSNFNEKFSRKGDFYQV